ncbi:sensor histidine kinase [Massilia pseudoviolaceinigra]|uniref:sensor histidine kinase n=1 Tax=Massilia pseudoviolaceinigra TaxID=3057165 RepID=UPI00279662D4|nr:sensor histidine kinase [Massilia sp. CCM 9206]MDQ1920357.1 triple tyrosine motif-containing protein [Massilia sp. CCM 9206]
MKNNLEEKNAASSERPGMAVSMTAAVLRRSLAWATLVLSCAAHAGTPPLSSYAHTAWNGQRGAPADVLQFTQTLDGWLWISSPNGLFRFDGVDFERMDSVQGHRLHSTSTLGLLTTRDGRLWVGGRFGGISMFADGRMHLYSEADGLPRGAVMTMTEGPDGSVWAATSSGLGHLAPGAARFRRVGRQEGLPEKPARQILYGRDGRQWVSVEGGIYFRDPGQAGYRRAWPHIDLMAMAEAPDGTLWGSDGVDKHYRVLPAAPRGNPQPRAELGGNGALFDRDGTMWILKVNALERRQAPYVGKSASAQQLTRANGMSGPLPQSAFEDREGNLWIGTSAGLDRLRRTRLRPVPVATAFDRPGVIADERGGVIIGDRRQPLRRYDAQGAHETLGRLTLTAAYRAADGALWLASFNERWRRAASGGLTRLPHPAHLAGHDMQAMTIDGKGRMWGSLSRQGLFRIEDGAWRKDGGLPGMPDGLALALATDPAGRVWAGFLRNRIALIDDTRVRVFGEADGLRLGDVQSLLVDGPRIWAGGRDGLAWYDGRRWHGASAAGGQRWRGISGMVRTATGELWLYGSDGISRIGAADVERLLREPAWPLPFERFDGLDGLVGSAEQLRPLPSMTQSTDGRLWFATASEVASIDPATVSRNRLAPPVQVLSLRSGDVAYPAQERLRLPTGARDLRIAYTALSLAIPERVHFRYKLDGFDQRWQDAGTRREAVYTNLRPGAYRFRVAAANEDGVWNDTGATLELVLPPRFVETGWFIALMVLLGAALLGALYWLRVRRLTERMRDRMQERLAERERIARGLHDTLLQSVQGLIMLFGQQARSLPIGTEERGKIEQTLELADELMTEGRDCISDLRSAGEPEELGQALAQYGRVLLQQRFTASIQGKPRTLSSRVRDEVQAIAREALFNASRHARATRVELVIDYRPDALAVLVRDNGCGMAAPATGTAPPRKHYGIVGMCERARALGAACTLHSAPGQGTCMQLDIPAEQAYPGRRTAALFQKLRQRRRAHAEAA